MDIYKRMYELLESEKENITDREILESAAYQRYIQHKAINIISGSFYAMRKMGFKTASVERENQILKNLTVEVHYDVTGEGSKITAYTEEYGGRIKKYLIYINAGHEIVQKMPSRKAKNWAVLGMLYHEIGHLLFTDFATFILWQTQMENNTWFPKKPEGLNTVNGASLEQHMAKDPKFCRVLAHCAGILENALEDAYIEEEMRQVAPGKGAAAIDAIGGILIETTSSLEEDESNPDCTEFMSLMGQILLFAKYGESNIGNYSGELLDAFEECFDVIEDIRYERSPKKRAEATNELLCITSPYLLKHIEEMQQRQQPQGSGSAGQQSGSSGQSSGAGGSGGGNGNGDENPGGTPDQPEIAPLSEEDEKLLHDIMDQLAKNNNNTERSNLTSKAVNNPDVKSNKNAPASQHKKPSGPRNGNAGEQGTGESGTGAGNGDNSDFGAGELSRVIEEIARQNAQEEVERERTEELNRAARNIDCDEFGINGNVSANVVRAESVSDENKRQYDQAAPKIKSLSRDLQREIARILKDRRAGGKRKNLPFGRRLEVCSVVHGDGKYFSRNKMPTESPRLGVGVLVDESGSTGGELISAARYAALVIEDFCRELEIPHVINGYTSGDADCSILSYAEPDEIDDSNRYRITGMTNRGGTPTAAALIYMMSRMKKLPADIRLLLVITDGCSCDNFGYYGYDDGGSESKPRIARIISTARKNHTIIVAAGIGSCKQQINDEFGDDNFLPIDDLEEMPSLLCKIIKDHLWV